MLSLKVELKDLKKELVDLDVANPNEIKPTPKYAIPEDSMPPEIAYDIVHNEMNLDGNTCLNVASFVTTKMDKHAQKLMLDTVNKNYVDLDEYPQTTEIQNRCVNMLSRLFHSPDEHQATGTATIGSSEAIMLCALALKFKWRKRREAAGLPIDKPNLVMSRDVHVCWEKFARYFDVEPRFIDLTDEWHTLNPEKVINFVDENTIGVAAILGTTMTGEFDDIEKLNDILDKINKKNDWEIPIHVDAASGGFIAPFAYPKLKWDFRLKWVHSINVSGHKYGLVYPGLGWAIWRNPECLPEELIFHVNYLGSDEPTFNMNFSKGSNNIVAQYYNFLRLGMSGYRRIVKNLLTLSDYISDQLLAMEKFALLSKKTALPVVCVKLKDDSKYSVYDISEKIRERGWIVPAYTLPPNADDISVLRIVVREGFNRDLADLLIDDIKKAIKHFEEKGAGKPTKPKSKLTHRKIC